MAGDDVLEYVREHLEDFGPTRVKQTLVAAGYDEHVAEHAIAVVVKEQTRTKLPTVGVRHTVIIAAIVLVAALVFFLSTTPPSGYPSAEAAVTELIEGLDDRDAQRVEDVIASEEMFEELGMELSRGALAQRLVELFEDTDVISISPRLQRDYVMDEAVEQDEALGGQTWFADIQAAPFEGRGYLGTIGRGSHLISPDMYITLSDHPSVSVIDSGFSEGSAAILLANHQVGYEGAGEQRRPVSITGIEYFQDIQGGTLEINGEQVCTTETMNIESTCERRLVRACQDGQSQWCQDVESLCDLCAQQGTCNLLQDITVELSCGSYDDIEEPHLVTYGFTTDGQEHEIRMLAPSLIS